MQTQEELLRRIRELEAEVTRWKGQVSRQHFGLTWIDVPEDFDQESRDKLPILEEVPEREVCHDDGKPTHILIEGDNYHALTCLNYTHRGKVDVIYIDPPYNTGKDDFTYRDKRIMDKFPNGTPVPVNHPLRHSTWLSFMNKRLRLAKDLLRDGGTIFISIDENELYNLRLLCDSIWGSNNFIGQWNWFKSATPPALSHKIKRNIEYILAYENKKSTVKYRGVQKTSKSDDPLTKKQNSLKELTFPPKSIHCKMPDGRKPIGVYGTAKYPNELLTELVVENGVNANSVTFRNRFIWLQDTLDEEIKKQTTFNLSSSLVLSYKRKDYSPEIPPNFIDKRTGVSTTEEAGKQLVSIFGKEVFRYPKPVSLIEYLLSFRPCTTILDFFAGSGTTMHAVMNLNEKDNGRRQCILCQSNEENICTDVTYERNRRVICGYTDSKGNAVAGLGGSLKYYRTAFVGKYEARQAADEDRVALAQRAGCLLALAESTLYEDTARRTTRSQFFSDRAGRHTAIYFAEDYSGFDRFGQEVREVARSGGEVCIYVFSWGDAQEFAPLFADVPQARVKSIPQSILDIYKSLNS